MNIGVWIAALCTIAIYSFLYKENPLFTFAEHLFLGLSVGVSMCNGYQSIMSDAIRPIQDKGQWQLLVAIVGGLLLLTRFVPKISWTSRLTMGYMMGVAAGLSLNRAIDSEFWRQMKATMNLDILSANGLLYVVTVISVLAYFFFGASKEQKIGGLVVKAGVLGQYLMMIAFGASLGSTIMARLSLVISRLQFLFGTWIPILPKG